MTEAARGFIACADHVAQLAVTHIRTDDNATQLIFPSFQMAWAQLHVLRGSLDGSLAKALIPFAARPLFEDGARWGWHTVHVANGETSGIGLHSMIADSRNRVIKVRDSLAGDGIPNTGIDHLLGGAIDLLQVQIAAPLPPMEEMLAIAHPSPSGIETANAIYSLLSQFVHATPIAQLHLQQDEFPSLTAPMYAVAVEATCRGFWRIAVSTLAISCEKTDRLDASLAQLSISLGGVIREATQWHLLG